MFQQSSFLQFLLAASILGACNHDGNGSGGGTAVDAAAPTVTIDFPPLGSITDATSIHVRGHASDVTGVASIRVNGVLAATDDGFANWSAQIPVGLGDLPVVIASTDTLGNTDSSAASTAVRSDGPFLFDVRDVVVDPEHGRALLVDAYQRALIGINLKTSMRFMISGPDATLGLPFSLPCALVLSPDASFAWVADALTNAIFRVDLATGIREVVSSPGVGTGPNLVSPQSLAYDATQARLFVSSGVPVNSILAVDPSTGNRMVLTGPTFGSGMKLVAIQGLAAGGPHGSLLVTDSSFQGVVSVSTSNGNRTLFSGDGAGYGPLFLFPTKCTLDAVNQRLLVADDEGRAVVAVTLPSGNRMIVSQKGLGTGPALEGVHGLAWNGDQEALLVAQSDRLLRVDLVTGDREVFTSTARGVGLAFEAPTEIAYDEIGDMIYVVDSPTSVSTIYSVERSTGNREPVSVLTGSGAAGACGLEIDRGHAHVLTLGCYSAAGASAVVCLDLPHYSADLIGPVNLRPATVVDMSAEFGGSRMLLATDSALYAIALATNTLSLLSDNSMGQGTLLAGVARVASHPDGVHVLATQAMDGSRSTGLVSIDLVTGERRLVSSSAVGSGPLLTEPSGLALDGSGDTAIVVDVAQEALVQIDLVSGNRTNLSQSPTVPLTKSSGSLPIGSGPTFASPLDVTLDLARFVAYTTHRFPIRGVLAVDLVSGDRVLISR